MSGRWRWIVGGVLVVGLIVAGVLAMTATTPTTTHSQSVHHDVIDLTDHDRPLRGEPVDFIAVGSHYVGMLYTTAGTRFVTSSDGERWTTVKPLGLPGTIPTATYSGGLGAAQHLLFSDGDALYLRVVTGSDFDQVGTVSLYASDAHARTWRAVALPAPAGEAAFPIAALHAHGRSYVAGSVQGPKYGRDYLDAAVWVSDGDEAWRQIDAPAFAGKGNQTIFTLADAGGALIAGGGDGASVDNTQCCYFGNGAAFWRSADGDHWSRASTNERPYGRFESATVVGFVRDGTTIRADMSGPSRTAESNDFGRTWTMTFLPPGDQNDTPRAARVLHLGKRFVATSFTPGCTDCSEGRIVSSVDGAHWRDIAAPFPCASGGRPDNGFVSPPVVIAGSVVALAGCGPALGSYDSTLLAVSNDGGTRWTISPFAEPTGGPMGAIVNGDRIVTLMRDGDGSTEKHRLAGQVRALVVHP